MTLNPLNLESTMTYILNRKSTRMTIYQILYRYNAPVIIKILDVSKSTEIVAA